MNFPRHRYLGPGNPLDNGPPVDRDDEIARQHDTEYEQATAAEHIRASDRKAIGSFGRDFITTGNWHSAVGALGLGAKYGVESVTGVLYPRLPTQEDLSRKRKLNETTPTKMADGPPAKQPRLDGRGTSTTGDAVLTQTGAGGGPNPAVSAGSSASEHTNVSMTQRPEFHKGKLVFNHQRMMFSYGYQFKSFKTQCATSDQMAESLTLTPYANVPVDCVPWYLTPSEFDNLPVTSGIKRCVTVVTPMGYRTPFITNSSGINSVNSNLLVFGMCAHGLNNRYNGDNVLIKSDASNPMYPTGYDWHSKEGCDHELWWGKKVGDETDVGFANIHAGFGNMQKFSTYYAQNLDHKNGAPSLPELNQSINYFPMINGVGNTPIIWEYRPQVNVLKPAYPYAPLRDNANGKVTRFNFGQKITGQTLWDINLSGHGQSGHISQKKEAMCGIATVPYESYVEQCGSLSHGFVEYAGGVKPPSLHIGVLPVHAYSTNISDSTVQEIVAIYKVETEIEIEYSFNFTHTYESFVPPNLATWADNNLLKLGSYPHWFNGYRSFVGNNPDMLRSSYSASSSSTTTTTTAKPP